MNSKGKEVPHGVRLYSIAASRYGDNFDGQTTSLCVRRATYWDPELKADDPAKKGLCSNFLCDAKPGDEINMTGAGKQSACAQVFADGSARLLSVLRGSLVGITQSGRCSTGYIFIGNRGRCKGTVLQAYLHALVLVASK